MVPMFIIGNAYASQMTKHQQRQVDIRELDRLIQVESEDNIVLAVKSFFKKYPHLSCDTARDEKGKSLHDMLFKKDQLHPRHAKFTELLKMAVSRGENTEALWKEYATMPSELENLMLYDPERPFTHADNEKSALLFFAVKNGDYLLAETLLSEGISPNIRKHNSEDFPLMVAVRSHRYGLIELLLSYNANVNATDSDIAIETVSAGTNSDGETVLSGVPVDNLGGTKKTAFIQAAMIGELHAMKLLHAAGADSNFQDNKGRTALHHAVEAGHTHIVQWLLTLSDFDINTTTYAGLTALNYALKKQDENSIVLLRKVSATENAISCNDPIFEREMEMFHKKEEDDLKIMDFSFDETQHLDKNDICKTQ